MSVQRRYALIKVHNYHVTFYAPYTILFSNIIERSIYFLQICYHTENMALITFAGSTTFSVCFVFPRQFIGSIPSFLSHLPYIGFINKTVQFIGFHNLITLSDYAILLIE